MELDLLQHVVVQIVERQVGILLELRLACVRCIRCKRLAKGHDAVEPDPAVSILILAGDDAYCRRAVQELIRALHDPHRNVRDAAHESLQTITGLQLPPDPTIWQASIESR